MNNTFYEFEQIINDEINGELPISSIITHILLLDFYGKHKDNYKQIKLKLIDII
jgi:hypothetical protein